MTPERVTPADLERIRERHADIQQDELRIDNTTPTEGEHDE